MMIWNTLGAFPLKNGMTLKNYTSIDPRSMEFLSSIFRKLNLFRTDSKYTYSYKDILGKKQT